MWQKIPIKNLFYKDVCFSKKNYNIWCYVIEQYSENWMGSTFKNLNHLNMIMFNDIDHSQTMAYFKY